MTKTDRERRPVRMRRTERGLEPVSADDVDELFKYKLGSHVNVRITQRRSNPQQDAYWEGLKRAVKATEAFPNKDYMHEAIKWDLGYRRPIKGFDGKLTWVPDSTAFGAMDRAEFTAFFDKARKYVIEQMHFDPWEFLESEKAA